MLVCNVVSGGHSVCVFGKGSGYLRRRGSIINMKVTSSIPILLVEHSIFVGILQLRRYIFKISSNRYSMIKKLASLTQDLASRGSRVKVHVNITWEI